MSNENLIKYKEGDILKYEFMDEPIRFFEVTGYYHWTEYDDAVYFLKDLITGEEVKMNTSSSFELVRESKEKYGWVQNKELNGWSWKKITDSSGLEHIGENYYIETKRRK